MTIKNSENNMAGHIGGDAYFNKGGEGISKDVKRWKEEKERKFREQRETEKAKKKIRELQLEELKTNSLKVKLKHLLKKVFRKMDKKEKHQKNVSKVIGDLDHHDRKTTYNGKRKFVEDSTEWEKKHLGY